jgi:hypothetical protein
LAAAPEVTDVPDRILRELIATLPRSEIDLPFDGPTVSFLCPTFGRAARDVTLLEEVVYWFTRQTYRNSELLILNDAPGQTLVCGVPRVRVKNWPYRIPSLGEKMNLMTVLALGSVLLPHQDDDVSLPWRAEWAVAALANADYWFAQKWVESRPGEDAIAVGVSHTGGAYRRSAFYNVYPHATKDYHLDAHAWACENLRVSSGFDHGTAAVNYARRRGGGDHLFSHPDPDAAYLAADPGPDGTYEIAPVVGRDWVKVHAALTGAGTGL